MSLTAKSNLHPVLRYFDVLLCALLAGTTVVISALTNPHAAAWLAGFYTTVALLIVVVRRIRESKLHKVFAVYLVMLASYLVTVWALHDMVPLGNNAGMRDRCMLVDSYLGFGAHYVPVALLSLTVLFLNIRSRILRALEWIGWGTGTVFFALHLLHILVADFFWSGHTWVPKFNPVYQIYFYFITFYLTLDLGIPVVVLFTTRQRQRRLQSLYYIIASTPLWLTCWSHFLIMLGINLYPAGGIFFFFHVSVISYAVLKHRVYDVTLAIRRSVPYALVSALLGTVYGLLVWSLMDMNLIATPTHSVLSAALFMACAGFVFAPALDYCRRAVDQFFSRADTDRQQRLEQFVRETSATVDLRRVIEGLCTLCDSVLKPARIGVYLSSDQGPPVLYGRYENGFKLGFWPSGDVLPEAVEAAIKNNSQAVIVNSDLSASRQTGGIQLLHRQETLAVPIFNLGERLGCVVLDGKRADEAYEEDEIRWAELAVNHCAVALANARSFAELERLQQLTTQTLENLTAGVLLLNHSGQILRSNATARKLLGAAPSSLAQLDMLQHGLALELQHALQHPDARQNVELSLTTPEAGRRALLLSVRPLARSDSEEPLLLALLHDITDYKQAELLARRNEGLARVGAMIAAINHEVRNIIQPVQRQLGFLQQITVEDAAVQRAITVMPERITALDRLLRNLTNLARPIELRKRPVDLKELVNAAWLEVRELSAEPARIHFQVEAQADAEHCVADGQYLKQVVYNLLKNALEATVLQSAPRIVATITRDDERARVEIRDNGAGIDPQLAATLFEPFHSTKGGAGTGLGLSISRRIIELHGGTLNARNGDGEGAVFSIELPAGVPVTAAPQSV